MSAQRAPKALPRRRAKSITYVVVNNKLGGQVVGVFKSANAADHYATQLSGWSGWMSCKREDLQVRLAIPEDGALAGNLTIKTHLPLSFITVTVTQRGSYLSSNFFDVPDEEFSEGVATGIAIASGLMAAIKANRLGADLAWIVMEDASRARSEDCRRKGASRDGAAMSFLRSMGEMIEFAAKHGPHESWFFRKAIEQQERIRSEEEWEAREGAKFAARMVEAKARKKAQREQDVARVVAPRATAKRTECEVAA